MFLYQDAVFIGQVYGRDDKKIETDTLNLKGTGGVFRHEYTEDFWKSYDEKDTRRDATFLEYYTKKNKEGFGCVMQKAIGSINSNNNRIYDTDFIVYRYADALLMMAEVENGLGIHVPAISTKYVNVHMAPIMKLINILKEIMRKTN